MARDDSDVQLPLDPVFAAIADQLAAGGRRMAESTVAQAREAIRATVATCAPGPTSVTAQDAVLGQVPVRTYRPDEPESPGTVVHLHGGGWVTGDLDYADALCRTLAETTGRQVISVDYRLAPEHPHPAALADLRTVLGHLVGDGPVLLTGDSAGANLAAVVAAQAATGQVAPDRTPPIIGQLLIYPVLDIDLERDSYRDCAEAFLGAEQMAWFLGHYLPNGTAAAAADPTVAPLRTTDLTGLPPTVLVTGGRDPLRGEAAAYAAALTAADVPVRTQHHPGLPHGFLQFTAVSPVAAQALADIADAARALWDGIDEESGTDNA